MCINSVDIGLLLNNNRISTETTLRCSECSKGRSGLLWVGEKNWSLTGCSGEIQGDGDFGQEEVLE